MQFELCNNVNDILLNFRPVPCRICSRAFPFELFLEHLRSSEHLEPYSSRNLLSGFNIEEEELGVVDENNNDVRETVVWEPIWLHHYGVDFFLFLEHFHPYWLLWMGALAPAHKEYTCSIASWNRDRKIRMEYVGGIHNLRASSMEVLGSGECLILSDATVRNLLRDGGIDVAVSVYPRRSIMGEDPASSSTRSSEEHTTQVLRRLGYR